jgi:hypothetical protein
MRRLPFAGSLNLVGGADARQREVGPRAPLKPPALFDGDRVAVVAAPL